MPITASSTPPPKRRTPGKSSAPAPVQSAVTARTEALNELGKMGSALCVVRHQYADSAAIANYWPGIARETALLAEGNEQVAKVVDYITSMGPYAGIITAVLPLALQIAANHGRVDADKLTGFGVLPPDMLEAQVKLQLERERLRMEAQIQAARDSMPAEKDAA